MLAAPDARAGSYVGVNSVPNPGSNPVTYSLIPFSGGTHFSRDQTTGQMKSLSDTGNASTYGGASGGGGQGEPPTCSGPITATWKWTPTPPLDMTSDPPPAQVIVMESCTASATISTPISIGKYDTGMGASGAAVWGQNNNTGSATSVRYSVQAGGPNLTLSPKVTPTSSGTQQGDSCSVSYSVTLSPVFVVPGGAIQDSSGGWNILVGQGCTASLTGIPTGTGFTTTYSWSVSGITFQKWTVTSSSASLTSGSGPLNIANPHWYWDDSPTTETVACTATVTPPNGQGSPFSVTASQNVALMVPQTTESPTVGRVQINNHGPTGYGSNYALYVGGNSSQPYGIIFTTQVKTPALFASQSSGLWNMVQGVAPNVWKTPYQKPEIPDVQNGKSGLDTRYPFFPTSNSSFPVGISANNLIAQPYDGPGIPNLSNTITRYRTIEDFRTYVMYLPPGTDTQWVPVWLVEWGWTADDTIPTFWSNWNDANDAGTVKIKSNYKTLIFPVWTVVLTG